MRLRRLLGISNDGIHIVRLTAWHMLHRHFTGSN